MENTTLVLKNVRLSYPHLDSKAEYKGEETGYEASFILDPEKHKGEIDKLKALSEQIAKNTLGKTLTKIEKAGKSTFKEGDDEKEETSGMFVIKAADRSKPPMVIGGDKSVDTDPDWSKFYGGCYVNVKIDLYGSKKHGRICAGLKVIQFAGEGEPFGAPPMTPKSAAEGFEEVEDDFDL